jgi:hypothetical protein
MPIQVIRPLWASSAVKYGRRNAEEFPTVEDQVLAESLHRPTNS